MKIWKSAIYIAPLPHEPHCLYSKYFGLQKKEKCKMEVMHREHLQQKTK